MSRQPIPTAVPPCRGNPEETPDRPDTASHAPSRSRRPLRPRGRRRPDHRPRHKAHPRRLRPLRRARHRDSGNRLGSRSLRAGNRRSPMLRRGTQNAHPDVQPRRPDARHPRRRHQHRRPQRGTAGPGCPPRFRPAPVPCMPMPPRIPRTRPPLSPRSRSTFGFPAIRLPDPRNPRASGSCTTPSSWPPKASRSACARPDPKEALPEPPKLSSKTERGGGFYLATSGDTHLAVDTAGRFSDDSRQRPVRIESAGPPGSIATANG
jgi:hypothetical protein